MKQKTSKYFISIAFTLALTIVPPASIGATDTWKIIRCGQLLDVKNKRILANQHILVKNSLIADIGHNIKFPESADNIDLSGHTCLPGLMDMHVHIFIDGNRTDFELQTLTDSVADKTLFGLRNLQSLLRQGFTTIRIVGDMDKSYASVALRDAINRGEFSGPRILVAPHLLSPTGGHGDANSFAPDSFIQPNINIVDGADDIRRMLRMEFKHGADWIKVMASGGIMSHKDDLTVSSYSDEELKVFVEETHRHGKKITAHAHGDAGARAAIKAGFDSIEHGTLMSEDTVKLMAKKGTFYIPTLYVIDWIIDRGKKGGLTSEKLQKAQLATEKHSMVVKTAYKHGVKIALGSDPIYPIEQAIREFNAMAKRIPDNWYVLQTGTINGAELLGLDDQLGNLEVGKRADIVATPANPIDDMKNIEKIDFVMKGGKVVRHDTSHK